VLLARDVLAYDDLRMGRLAIPIEFALRSGRAYYFICPKSREEHPHVRAFRSWIKQEVAALDWKQVKGAGGLRPRVPASRRAAALPRSANKF
jgi:LysR family transcriptional regulator, glycine cleavage system transcriptional activator